MPKNNKSLKYLHKQWIDPYNKTNDTVFTTDGDIVYCQVCDKKITCNKKSQVTQHVLTTFHKDALIRKKNTNKQLFLKDVKPEENNSFNKDLCLSLISANIPWAKLKNPIFRHFLEKYTSKSIPNESTLRKNYLGPFYKETLSEIRDIIGDLHIWFAVDETTDITGRYIANLLVGVLKCDASSQPYLIACRELQKTNHSTVSRFINDGLKLLWPLGGHDENVILMLSDAAPYMVKTAEVLKVFYPNIIHVTCVAHMLNRVAEKVRDIHPKVNKLINNVKKSFLKAPSRVQVYKELLPGVPLPPEPIITRWGTWIGAVIFTSQNFEGIKSVFESLNDDSACVQTCKELLNLNSVKNDLTFIQVHFSNLVRAITNLEASNLTLIQSLDIVKTIISELTNIQGEKGMIIKTKVTQLYQKNKGYQVMEKIGLVQSGNNEEQLPENLTPSLVADMKNAPLTSVDVERSFSLYKYILTDRRTNLTPEHMEQYIIVNSFHRVRS